MNLLKNKRIKKVLFQAIKLACKNSLALISAILIVSLISGRNIFKGNEILILSIIGMYCIIYFVYLFLFHHSE